MNIIIPFIKIIAILQTGHNMRKVRNYIPHFFHAYYSMLVNIIKQTDKYTGENMSNKENPRAALYIRVSTEEQALDGQSPSAQAETLKKYCSAFGIVIHDLYMDLGVSGKSLKDRLELKRLIEDCGSGRFNIVLVWKISRLSRNLKDLLHLIDIFERNNVSFASYSEKFDTSTPVGRMTLQLLGSIAEFERNTIVENVKLGLTEFARKGGKSSSLLGYNNVDKKLIINEEEAFTVRLIFKLYTESSMSCSAIAGYLNSMGCKTKRGCEFRGSSISYIIHNPAYIGINRHLTATKYQYSIKGTHSAIIDTELWNKVQETSSGIKKKAAGKATDYNGTQLKAFCMKCGMPLSTFYTSSKGRKYIYLRCCRCSNYVNAEKLTKSVLEEIKSIIGNKELREKAIQLISQDTDYLKYTIAKAESMDLQIKRLSKSKTRYLSLFENYKLSESGTFVDRITEIDTQIELLKKKKLQQVNNTISLNDSIDYESYIHKLEEELVSSESPAIKQLSECLIKKIYAYKNKINIIFNL